MSEAPPFRAILRISFSSTAGTPPFGKTALVPVSTVGERVLSPHRRRRAGRLGARTLAFFLARGTSFPIRTDYARSPTDCGWRCMKKIHTDIRQLAAVPAERRDTR